MILKVSAYIYSTKYIEVFKVASHNHISHELSFIICEHLEADDRDTRAIMSVSTPAPVRDSRIGMDVFAMLKKLKNKKTSSFFVSKNPGQQLSNVNQTEWVRTQW